VTVFDPYPAGAGAVYRPQQPPQWRLNVNCAIVTTAHDNFNAWRARHGEDTTDAFPPRAQVGQFLAIPGPPQCAARRPTFASGTCRTA